MFRSRTRAIVRALVATTTVVVASMAAPAAFGHTGGSNCAGDLTRSGALYQGTCQFPFQGYPIGMAAKFEPFDSTWPSNIHIEVTLHPAFGPDQSLSMECYDPEPTGGIQPTVFGTTRCIHEENDPVAAQQFTLVEPIPTEIVSMTCSTHSHAPASIFKPPSGLFACWSTAEARKDLEDDGILGQIGY